MNEIEKPKNSEVTFALNCNLFDFHLNLLCHIQKQTFSNFFFLMILIQNVHVDFCYWNEEEVTLQIIFPIWPYHKGESSQFSLCLSLIFYTRENHPREGKTHYPNLSFVSFLIIEVKMNLNRSNVEEQRRRRRRRTRRTRRSRRWHKEEWHKWGCSKIHLMLITLYDTDWTSVSKLFSHTKKLLSRIFVEK